MKNVKFFIAILVFSLFSFVVTLGAYLPPTPPPWWAGKLNPEKDIILTILIETERTTYGINEVVLFEIPIGDPGGLKGSVCVITGGSEGKIVACSFLSWYVIGKKGCQVEIPIMETKPGTYKYQARYLSEGKMHFSNEVVIAFTDPDLPLPSLGSQKTETATIDYYQYWWVRTLEQDKNGDNIPDWGKPMLSGTPRPTITLAPPITPAGKTPTIWGQIRR